MPTRYVARGPFSTEFIAKCREGPLLGRALTIIYLVVPVLVLVTASAVQNKKK